MVAQCEINVGHVYQALHLLNNEQHSLVAHGKTTFCAQTQQGTVIQLLFDCYPAHLQC